MGALQRAKLPEPKPVRRVRGATAKLSCRAWFFPKSRLIRDAAARGIIIADTKFEFGLDEQGAVQLIDEALTPDSSRFWPAGQYSPGRPQPSFDKQYVRDYLERIGWNKQPPAPALPPDVVAATREKYREAYQRVTGHALD